MNPELLNRMSVSKPIAVFFLLLLLPAALFAQNGDAARTESPAEPFVGNYKGTVKGPDGDVSLTLEIKSEKGLVSGRLVTPQGEQQITSSEAVAGKLTLKFGPGGNAGTLLLLQRDSKVVGEWKMGGQASRSVEFQRVSGVTESAAVAVKKTPEPSSAGLLTGEWDAAADAQGQAFPFTLVLKVDGERVTGSSSSQLGDSTISSGSWKDGKLAIVLDAANGPIALAATLTDGKLVGDYDFAGQLQGKWIATKKKP